MCYKGRPGCAGQGNIAGPMSTLWEGTTLVQGLRNRAPEHGEGEMRQGCGLTRLKKLYYCAPACMSSVQSRGISNCSSQ